MPARFRHRESRTRHLRRKRVPLACL